MNTRKFTQIGYTEGITYIDLNGEKFGNKIEIEIYPKVLETDDNERLPLQLTVRYLNPTNGKKLFEYGGIAFFETKVAPGSSYDWLEDSSKRELWINALGFFRGIICEKLRGTGLERFMLPQMSDEDIYKI